MTEEIIIRSLDDIRVEETVVSEKWIQFVDEAVLVCLPKGSQIVGVWPYGASYSGRTAEIKTINPSGDSTSYLLKVTQGDVGKVMINREWIGQQALYAAAPRLVLVPVGWGTYRTDPSIHFFLSSFVDMIDDVPDPYKLGSMLADLHRTAVSPTGKFGFEISTGGIFKNGWHDTWEACFTAIMRDTLELAHEAQGPDLEIESLSEVLISKVIPRLIRPMEVGGRHVRPSLVHGDLWSENASTDAETDLPLILNSTCLYAHNEYELAPWRLVNHKMGRAFIKAYQKFYPITAPAEDCDDRIMLYSIKFNILRSAYHPGNLLFRHIVLDDMRYLVVKYADGYEGWATSFLA